MSVSRPCEQCEAVKQCRMYMDETEGTAGVPVYLCMRCAQELGYFRAPTQAQGGN